MNDHPDQSQYLLSDETVDSLGYSDLRIIQPRKGFRTSIDPVLLAGFTRVNKDERWIDLGTGSGILPLLLAKRENTLQLTGVEINKESADRAQRNILINKFEKQIDIIHGDLRSLRKSHAAQSFSAIITNPPYRKPESGRISQGEDRAVARHELHGTLDDFLDISRYLLKNDGRFYTIYLAERLPELLHKMSTRNIEPKRIRCIHSHYQKEANLVLIEGRRSGRPGLKIEPPLFIYEGNIYSKEVQELAGNITGAEDQDPERTLALT